MTISTTRAVERCERLAKLGPPPVWWRALALRRWLRDYRTIMALDISVSAEMLRSLYPADKIERLTERPALSFAALRVVPRSEREP